MYVGKLAIKMKMCNSLEEFPYGVEMWYKLFLMIDMCSYEYKDQFSGGCTKFRSVRFFKIQDGRHENQFLDIIAFFY